MFTEVEVESKTSKIGHISETKNVVIKSVLDPRSEQFIDVDTAVRRRLLETQQGTYTHPITDERMTIQTALERGFLRADSTSSNELVSSAAIKESRSFTITGAVDPTTGHREAIKKGYIIATSTTLSADDQDGLPKYIKVCFSKLIDF